MSTEQNKEIVRRAVSAIGRGEVTLYRRLAADCG